MGSDIRQRFKQMTMDDLRKQVAFYADLSAQAKSVKSPYHWILRAAREELSRRSEANSQRFRRLTK